MNKVIPIPTGKAWLKSAKKRGGEGRNPFQRKIDIFRDKNWLCLEIFAWLIEHPEGRFIVDTGASFSMLDESQLKPLGLSTVKQSTSHTGSLIPDEETGRTAGFGKVSVHNFHVCPVKRLDIGAKELKDAHLGVVNLKAWGLLKPGSPAQDLVGLLGTDLLAGQGALIDFDGCRLWFPP